jgi:serine/threonine-protein kinase
VLGTTDYVSPEQAMGQEVDERSDVYSLGVVLYEMLSGDVPYHAETQVGVAMKHVNEEMPDVYELRPDLSAAVASVVDRATAKDPHERYGSVDEMVRDLEATLEVEAARGGGTTGEATTVLRSVRRQRRLRPSRMSAAGIAMGIVGLALIGAAVWLGSEELDGDGEAGGSSQSRVRLADATAFDPEGDGDEHSDEAALAVDGNPTGTAWPTETYLGALGKAGVGIYVEAEKPVEATELELRLAEGGADVEIYAAPGATEAPEDLDGWTLIGEESDVGARGTIALDPLSRSSLYLVWFTKLPPAEDDPDGLRAEVSDIRLVE